MSYKGNSKGTISCYKSVNKGKYAENAQIDYKMLPTNGLKYMGNLKRDLFRCRRCPNHQKMSFRQTNQTLCA